MRLRSVLPVVALVGAATVAVPASANPAAPPGPAPHGNRCAPSGAALSYSDALDKLSYDGATVGGLSSLAYDPQAQAWVSAVDNHLSDPSRLWFFRDLTHPTVVRDPLVLRRPDGTAYNGMTADNEGLAVLPDGDYLVSSETEPSIRIFGRDGVQKASLPVPDRFRVAPAGQATSNATLEGLTIDPSGHQVVAAMEGALSGDTDATLHRFLVYTDRGGTWRLAKQIAYRAAPGQRIPEVAAIDRDRLIVEEASFDPASGNVIDLYAADGVKSAPDVSAIADLATAPKADILHKKRLANLVRCPTLGAPSRETQANPLLDNYEGMAITSGPYLHGIVDVSLISDDNFSATQTTRVLNLALQLPPRS